MLMFLYAEAEAAPRVDLGLGLRTGGADGLDEAPYGARLFGRLRTSGHLAVELGAYGRFPGSTLTSTGLTVLYVMYEADTDGAITFPVARELATFDALVQLSPWERPDAEGISAWVYGIGGAGAAVVQTTRYTFDADTNTGVEAGGATTAVAPIGELGLGFDVMFSRHVGARVMALGRLSTIPAMDLRADDGVSADRILTGSSVASLDLVVTL